MQNEKELAEQIQRICGVNPRKCMKCGKCSGACPAYDAMPIHPHQFVALVERGEVEGLLDSEALWNCLSCMACIERCPRGVEPAKFIEAVRVAYLRRKGEKHLKADDIPSKLNQNLPQQAITCAFRKYSK